ncbi:thioredoxin family protein [Microbacterium sp. cf332]|uniref:TlpA family protein disulfide reductase n=1 Tax=Microbacterium sp. cf332 TaxID=1761804 RepID=UPI00210B595F|nr:thioredoxin family protein [Microbacterium sp. cf332]
MQPLPAVALTVALVVLVATCGVLARRRSGRPLRVADGEVVTPAMVDAPAFGRAATLLQFSTELCTRCPGARRVLSSLADGLDGVRHVDVDLTYRPDLARRFSVMQTPTVLVLDRTGRVRQRTGGLPDRSALESELIRLLQEA